MNVLFLCTGNSCRSVLAEATFNHLAPAGWRAMSAGSHPAGYVHPRALALLAREGYFNRRLFQQIVERSAADAGYCRDSLFKRCWRNLSGLAR